MPCCFRAVSSAPYLTPEAVLSKREAVPPGGQISSPRGLDVCAALRSRPLCPKTVLGEHGVYTYVSVDSTRVRIWRWWKARSPGLGKAESSSPGGAHGKYGGPSGG
jgi:hypothetical protein